MKNPQAYDECLDKMFALGRFGIKLGLDVIGKILENLDSPQNSFLTVHISGTNGKGSIASGLSSILTEAGFTTGLYTSPHLVKFNERISVNNIPISDADVVAAYEAVNSASDGTRDATFFEIATAMSLYHFKTAGVGIAIIETGMGGRLDATNVLKPVLSIISNISVEHRTYLGDTIKKIAFEKAGIIKPNTPVITGVTQPDAIHAIEEKAHNESADLYRLGKNFKIRRNNNQTFSYFGLGNTWREMKTELPGRHQVDNAALVLASCEVLNSVLPRFKMDTIPVSAIRNGLTTNRWPGRLEKVSDNPLVIIDGAHNLAAAKTLAKYISEELAQYKITLVAGILDDKPYEAILKTLVDVCDKVIITMAKNSRSLDTKTLERSALKNTSKVERIPDVATAIRHAYGNALPHEAIIIAGSLYVAGEAKDAIEKGILKAT